jgi:PAS domain S-box-containing protein
MEEKSILYPERASNSIKKDEKFYQSLFENMLNGFAYCKMHFDENDKPLDFTYVSVNKAFEKITGLKNVEGKKVTDVIPGIRENDSALFEVYGRVSNNGLPETLEMFIESLQMWFSLSVYCPQQGYFVAVFDVITERKKEKEALKESEERFRAIFEQAAIGVALLNTKTGQFVRINQKYCDFVGYSMQEMLQKTFMDISYYEDIQTNVDNNRRLIEGGPREFTFEKRYVHKNGNIIWGNITISPLWKAEEKPEIYFHIAIVEDITIRKQTELIIQQQNNQLQELNASKDKFFSIIAHDLRSPFQVFLGLTQSMAEDASDYTVKELALLGNEMHKLADNLYNLLKNLLDWAQMQKGSMTFQPKIFSLSDQIAKNTEILRGRCEQKGITIINAITNSIEVYADEKMINSVLLNLLSNAVKFTDRNGRVKISAVNIEKEKIKISVRDTGIGIVKSDVEKLFKVGENLNRKGTEGELSTGLGLILCKEFVEKNGGTIWAESEEGKGSTFHFTIPDKDRRT